MPAAIIKRIVLDASVAVAWCYELVILDQRKRNPYSESV